MPTEEDIRSALSTYGATVEPPQDPDRLLGERRGSGGSRVRLLAAVAAVTAAAIVIPVVVLTRPDPDTATPPAPDRLSIAQEFRFDPPAGWQEVGRSIRLDRQNLVVVGPAKAQCEVNVHRPGGFDAGRIPPGSAPLTVNGRPGYFARIVNPTDVERLGAGPTPIVIDTPEYARWTVVWQYAEGAWAVVVCPIGAARQDISAAEARRRELLVAAGLTFERGVQRVPFKAGYLPPGREPVTAWVQAPGAPHWFMEVYWFDVSWRARGHAVNVGIRVGNGLFERSPAAVDVMVGGRRGWAEPVTGMLVVPGEGYQLVLRSSSGWSDDLRATLVRIAEGIEIAADPADRSTWFDGRDAFPR